MRRESEAMCETSEPGERLIQREDVLPIKLDVGRRILEVFGYQRISAIVFRLKSTRREIDRIVSGEEMPSSELLLGIRKVSGASIDWILTGEGQKYVVRQGQRHVSRGRLRMAAKRCRDGDEVPVSSLYL